MSKALSVIALGALLALVTPWHYINAAPTVQPAPGEGIGRDSTVVLADSVSNATLRTKAWTFVSPAGASGTFWVGGFYEWEALPTAWASTASVTVGGVDAAHAAHLSFICGGSITTDDTLRVFGAHVANSGVLVDPDTTFIYMAAADSVGQYFETSELWVGQITIERVSVALGSRSTNIGFSKYWDKNNTDFTVKGMEAVGRAGANDTGFNIKLRHHKPWGWDYNAVGPPNTGDHPAELCKMNTDHGSGKDLFTGLYFAYKRDNLDSMILGAGEGHEGVVFEVITGANKALESSNFLVNYTTE